MYIYGNLICDIYRLLGRKIEYLLIDVGKDLLRIWEKNETRFLFYIIRKLFLYGLRI